MKKSKRAFCLALALCMMLCLAACGGNENYKTLETIGEKHYGIAFRYGDKIAEAVCAAMDELNESGKLSELSLRWLGTDVISYTPAPAQAAETPTPSVEPAGEEGQPSEPQPSETAARVLIVGIEDGAFPFAYTENGGVKGMSADIAQELGAQLGWEIRILPIKSAELYTQLRSGNIDCAIGFGIESVKLGELSIGPSFIKSEILLVTSKENGISAISALEGGSIATTGDLSVLSALNASEKIAKYAPELTTADSIAQAIASMQSGDSPALAIDKLMLDCNLVPKS